MKKALLILGLYLSATSSGKPACSGKGNPIAAYFKSMVKDQSVQEALKPPSRMTARGRRYLSSQAWTPEKQTHFEAIIKVPPQGRSQVGQISFSADQALALVVWDAPAEGGSEVVASYQNKEGIWSLVKQTDLKERKLSRLAISPDGTFAALLDCIGLLTIVETKTLVAKKTFEQWTDYAVNTNAHRNSGYSKPDPANHDHYLAEFLVQTEDDEDREQRVITVGTDKYLYQFYFSELNGEITRVKKQPHMVLTARQTNIEILEGMLSHFQGQSITIWHEGSLIGLLSTLGNGLGYVQNSTR